MSYRIVFYPFFRLEFYPFFWIEFNPFFILKKDRIDPVLGFLKIKNSIQKLEKWLEFYLQKWIEYYPKNRIENYPIWHGQG